MNYFMYFTKKEFSSLGIDFWNLNSEENKNVSKYKNLIDQICRSAHINVHLRQSIYSVNKDIKNAKFHAYFKNVNFFGDKCTITLQ